MLQGLLSSVIVKLLTAWGKALYQSLLKLVKDMKRSKEQKTAIDDLQKKTDAGASREEKHKSEIDYLNS